MENISSKVWNEIRVSILLILTQYSAWIISQSNKARKRKGLQIGKEEVKLYLYSGGMILQMENCKGLHKKKKREKTC
jgi:hypothetical protein